MAKKEISTFGLRATSIVSVWLVLVLVGVGAMLAWTGRNLEADLRTDAGFTLVLAHDAPAGRTDALRDALAADRAIASVTFVSADSILRAEEVLMGAPLGLGPGVNPYSHEIRATVRPEYCIADSLAAVAARYGQYAIIEEMVVDSDVLRELESAASRIWIELAAIGALLLAISVVLIHNAVSLSIYSKRFGIYTMRLVGATPAFIRRPFVRGGAINGLLAGLLASAALCGLRHYAGASDPALGSLLPWGDVAWICAAVAAAGMLLCCAIAAITVSRYLRKSYDELFMK